MAKKASNTPQPNPDGIQEVDSEVHKIDYSKLKPGDVNYSFQPGDEGIEIPGFPGADDDDDEADDSDENLEQPEGTSSTEDDTSEGEEAEGEGEEEGETEQPALLFVEEIAQSIGYEGKVEFEDSEEGIVQLFNAAQEQNSQKKFDSVMGQFPMVKDFYEYVKMGGEPANFLSTKFPAQSFANVTLDKDSVELQEHIVAIKMQQEGFAQEEIVEQITALKGANVLLTQANASLKYLQREEQKAADNLLPDQEALVEEQKAQAAEYIENFEKELGTGNNFGGFIIPEPDKEDFTKFVTEVDNETGQTALMKVNADLTVNQQISLYWFLYKNLDVTDTVIRKVKDKLAKDVRKRLTKTKPSSANSLPEDIGNPTDVANIDWGTAKIG